MTLYLVRHGETDYNRQFIVQGSGVNSDLNDIGRRQAQDFFDTYRHVPFDTIFISTLKRTRQTLAPFILRGSIPVIETADLNEISWGIHEGQKATKETATTFNALMAAWMSGNYHERLPEGESAAELYERTSRFVAHLKAAYRGKHVLVCTHGRTLLCLLTILKQVPLSTMNDFKHQNTGVYRAHFRDDVFHFDLENDVQHLVSLNS
jgi:probable phosphoglycerate mutase